MKNPLDLKISEINDLEFKIKVGRREIKKAHTLGKNITKWEQAIEGLEATLDTKLNALTQFFTRDSTT